MKEITITIEKLILKPFNIKSDTVGALASGLCMLHCLATPFFFIASACSSSCCNNAPLWWQWMDYVFLGIAFFAIQQTSKSSKREWVVQGLWVSWTVLFLFMLNIKLEWIQISENLKFIPAFALVGLHVYNMRFCQCEKECC
ncbi:MAG: hypothetical protein CMG60_06060 [Candidatus Marinimicrobia bacterium]|nr:hypothetical protein [Candidatus Neomarinimicrobiota bacterium]|tara:strand:- start:915 stop:1340 length:426 start_codon:yes stop_codon:yes gene_type:complete